MKTEDLAKLAEIARLMADRDLAALAAIRAKSSALARAAEDLRARPNPDPVQSLEPAQRAGAGPLWIKWRNGELRRIEQARAGLAAEEAIAREVAAKSFGRKIALDELKEKAADRSRIR